MFKKVLSLSILAFPFSLVALGQGFIVDNTTDLDLTTMIGQQAGMVLESGHKLHIPYGPFSAKCYAAAQDDVCHIDILNANNDDLVASLSLNPENLTVLGEPMSYPGYEKLSFDGWQEESTITNLVVYYKD